MKKAYSICIIEDDMVSQFASRYCLEQFAGETFVISTFDSAENALNTFRVSIMEGNSLPDVIFLDLGLDEMDGWTFLENLQKVLNGKNVPKIYILSAFGKTQDRELAQNHPLVLGYMDKPLTRNRLEKIFGEKRA